MSAGGFASIFFSMLYNLYGTKTRNAPNGGRMDNKEKLSRDLLREIRKDPEFRKVSNQQQLAKDVGAELARIRKKKRMSEQELAEKIGRTSKVIKRMEKG